MRRSIISNAHARVATIESENLVTQSLLLMYTSTCTSIIEAENLVTQSLAVHILPKVHIFCSLEL